MKKLQGVHLLVSLAALLVGAGCAVAPDSSGDESGGGDTATVEPGEEAVSETASAYSVVPTRPPFCLPGEVVRCTLGPPPVCRCVSTTPPVLDPAIR